MDHFSLSGQSFVRVEPRGVDPVVLIGGFNKDVVELSVHVFTRFVELNYSRAIDSPLNFTSDDVCIKLVGSDRILFQTATNRCFLSEYELLRLFFSLHELTDSIQRWRNRLAALNKCGKLQLSADSEPPAPVQAPPNAKKIVPPKTKAVAKSSMPKKRKADKLDSPGTPKAACLEDTPPPSCLSCEAEERHIHCNPPAVDERLPCEGCILSEKSYKKHECVMNPSCYKQLY